MVFCLNLFPAVAAAGGSYGGELSESIFKSSKYVKYSCVLKIDSSSTLSQNPNFETASKTG